MVTGPDPSSVPSPRPAAIGTAAAQWFSRRDAGLSADEEREFQHWLAADSRHGLALAELESAWSVFGKPARTGAVPDLERELALRAARRRRRRVGAAATALALLVVIAVFRRTPAHVESAVPPIAATVLFSPERRVLADGSVVSLKDGARIKESFTPGMRRVELLHGEAMFEVARDRARPFVVSARGVEISAVGTAFAVDLGTATVEVLITEGTVAIDQAGAAPTPPAGRPISAPPRTAALIEAGNRIVVAIAPQAPMPAAIPINAADLGERLAWRNRRVEFSGTTLAEAVAIMNREASASAGPRLVIADPSLGTVRISGIFRTDNTDAFVLLLEAGFGVVGEPAGDTVRLRRADSAASRR